MARPCTPRPETTRSKLRCSRPHRIWNTSCRPANSGAWNGAKANCNSAPFPAGGPMLRPVAELEAGTLEPFMTRWFCSSSRRLPMPCCDNNRKKQKMNKSKCPHCHAKLGNFLYADACPHCHEELKHNTRPLSARKLDSRKAKAWPFQILSRFQRFVES